MNASTIRRDLREGRSPELARRSALVALAAAGLLDFALIALYQTGVLERLPDLPVPGFDSNAVNAATTAYELGVPDGATGCVLYSLELVLAAAGGEERSRALDVLLAGAAVAGVAGAARYLRDMARNQQRACLYCLIGAGINVAMVPLALRGLTRKRARLRREVRGARSS